MKSKKFTCNSCSVEGIIKFHDDEDTFTESDVAYCPFCAHDIQDDFIEEEDSDSEEE